jgi:hypothetical protein
MASPVGVRQKQSKYPASITANQKNATALVSEKIEDHDKLQMILEVPQARGVIW